jgi:starch phosphorylase
VRIRQELLLGVGGFPRAEGHGHHARRSAPERRAQRIRRAGSHRSRMQEEGLTFDQAVPRVSREVVFTTHTPVPAGHDRFNAGLIEEHLGPLRERWGLSDEQLMDLGREIPATSSKSFCMTVLGLKLSRRANAVSALHGEVSRAMWTGLYPGKLEDEVPIGHITNGVHVPTWLAPQMFRLYDRHLGTGWHEHSGESRIWEGIETSTTASCGRRMEPEARLLEFVRRARGTSRAPRRIAENCKGSAACSARTR